MKLLHGVRVIIWWMIKLRIVNLTQISSASTSSDGSSATLPVNVAILITDYLYNKLQHIEL